MLSGRIIAGGLENANLAACAWMRTAWEISLQCIDLRSSATPKLRHSTTTNPIDVQSAETEGHPILACLVGTIIPACGVSSRSGDLRPSDSIPTLPLRDAAPMRM